MVKRFLPLSLVLLAGCALSPPPFAPATPIEIKVPVFQPVYCTMPQLANPLLPISALTASSPPADTLRAYAASVVLLKGAVRDLDSIIEGCSEPSPPPPPPPPPPRGLSPPPEEGAPPPPPPPPTPPRLVMTPLPVTWPLPPTRLQLALPTSLPFPFTSKAGGGASERVCEARIQVKKGLGATRRACEPS